METVVAETPARFAISLIVGFFFTSSQTSLTLNAHYQKEERPVKKFFGLAGFIQRLQCLRKFPSVRFGVRFGVAFPIPVC